jgi:hypothetical protein
MKYNYGNQNNKRNTNTTILKTRHQHERQNTLEISGITNVSQFLFTENSIKQYVLESNTKTSLNRHR